MGVCPSSGKSKEGAPAAGAIATATTVTAAQPGAAAAAASTSGAGGRAAGKGEVAVDPVFKGVARVTRAPWDGQLAEAAARVFTPIPRDAGTVAKLLAGRPLSVEELQSLGRGQGVCRLFLSSTFTDTEQERNLLISDVYPFLRELGAAVNVQVYQSSEMRWGIREEASAAHETSEICMAEIKRCQTESSGLNYVLILGNKYGFRPFPAKIPQAEFEALLPRMGESQALASSWFTLDTNAQPPTYVLQPLTKESGKAWWGGEFAALQAAFRTAAAEGLAEERARLYVQSVTTEEIDRGLLAIEPGKREAVAFVFDRQMTDIPLDHKDGRLFQDMADGKLDDDAQARLQELRDTTIPGALPAERMAHFSVPWGPGLDPAVPAHAAYLAEFADKFCEVATGSILSIAEATHFAEDPLVREVAGHELFARERQASFIPTASCQPILEAIAERTQALGSITAVLGASGTGKTSLMAAALQAAQAAAPDAIILHRFLGTSANSGSARLLLRSLLEQLHRALTPGTDMPDYRKNLETLASLFKTALRKAGRPVILFLDSLDQLSDEDNGRQLGWLQMTGLPSNVKVVVSMIPDVSHCGTVIEATLPATDVFRVQSMAVEDGQMILKQWLEASGRSLTAEQSALVLERFAQCPTPLYLKICAEQGLRWKSYTPASATGLAATVPALIEQVFEELEARHGKVLVQTALSYLCASREGLSDNEMEDLLSLNDNVLNEVFEWWIPSVRRIPPLSWTRVKSDLSWAVSSRGGLNAWYHRQHREAAERRYLTEALRQAAHEHLADYFAGTWADGKPAAPGEPAQDRKVAPMRTLLAGNLRNPSGKLIVNVRKLVELPFQLVEAGRWQPAMDTLAEFEFIEASARAGRAFDLAADFARVAKECPIDSPEFKQFFLYLQQNVNSFDRVPELTSTRASFFPEDSYPAAAMRRLYDSPEETRPLVRSPGKRTGFGHVVATLVHGERLSFLAFSPSDRRLAGMVTGRGNTLFVWDVATGVVQAKFKLADQNLFCRGGLMTSDDVCVMLAMHKDDKSTPILVFLSVESGTETMRRTLGSGRSQKLAYLYDPTRKVLLLGTEESQILTISTETWTETSSFSTEGPPGAFALRDDTLVFSAGTGLFWCKFGRDGTIEAPHLQGSTDWKYGFRHLLILANGDAVGTARHVARYDGKTGECVATTSSSGALALVDDGDEPYILVGDSEKASVHNAVSLEQTATIDGFRTNTTGIVRAFGTPRLVAVHGCNFMEVAVLDLQTFDPHEEAWHAPSKTCLLPPGAAEGHRVVNAHRTKSALSVYAAETGSHQADWALPETAGRVIHLIASANGKYVVTAETKKTVRVWDAGTGAEVDSFIMEETAKEPVISPDSRRFVAYTEDGHVMVYDLEGHRVLTTWDDKKDTPGHASTVNAVAWMGDGKAFVTGADDNKAIVWDHETGEPLTELPHEDFVSGIATGPASGGQLVTSTEEQGLKIWHAADAKCLHSIAIRKAFETGSVTVAIYVDWCRHTNLIASASKIHLPSIWNPETGDLLMELDRKLFFPRFLCGGRLLGAVSTGGIRFYDTKTGKFLRLAAAVDARAFLSNWTVSVDERFILTRSAFDGNNETVLFDFARSPIADALK